MEPLRSVAIGMLILLGVAALVGRLYTGLAAVKGGARPRTRYAFASAGLIFLACLAAGLTWFIMEPTLAVFVAALVASLVFACLDWATFQMATRLRQWFSTLAAKIERKERTK